MCLSAEATVSSYAACTQLIDFLNVRLKKNNHNVKYKCCVIIKVYLSSRGYSLLCSDRSSPYLCLVIARVPQWQGRLQEGYGAQPGQPQGVSA